MTTETNQTLKRSLTLTQVAFYGLGNILGAGIYVLIGKVAGYAGMYTPFSFLLASLLAAITAFTYAELSSRYPLSAGEAVYVHHGFSIQNLSLFVGLLIILTGIVSISTIARGFVGYTHLFISLPDYIIIFILITALGSLAAWGIVQSVRAAVAMTLIEIIGLLIIIAVSMESLLSLPVRLPELIPPPSLVIFEGIFIGGFLAFFAYVGFEDMVNVAEETIKPEKTMPYIILLCLSIASLLYILVALVCVLSVPPDILKNSEAPLAMIFENATGEKPVIISLISMFAVINGALIQLIMASRVCYGLARQNWIPGFFSKINSRTQTPVIATVTVTVIALIMTLWLPIITLAKLTTYFLLCIFLLINLSLARIKKVKTDYYGGFTVPMIVPVTGSVACVIFLVLQLYIDLFR